MYQKRLFRNLESYWNRQESVQLDPNIYVSTLPLFMQRGQQYGKKKLVHGLVSYLQRVTNLTHSVKAFFCNEDDMELPKRSW